MLGAVIGDMTGSIYERHNCKDEKRIKLLSEGSHPTDDSVMTAAVSKALIESMGKEDGEIKNALIDEMHYFGNLFPNAGYGGRFRSWLFNGEREPYQSFGNGSGMRVSAVGWLYESLEETLHAAELSAMVTHNHPEGIKGAQAIASAIFLARTGKSKEEIREYIIRDFYSLDFTLDEIRPDYRFDVSCQGSCPVAIEAFLEAEDFEDAVIKAISIGGDSDTIAAMAGGIAEAFYGIPEEIKKKAFEFLTDVKTESTVYKNSVIAQEVYRFWEYTGKMS